MIVRIKGLIVLRITTIVNANVIVIMGLLSVACSSPYRLLPSKDHKKASSES